MPDNCVLAIVIPVYNEEKHLVALLRDWQPVLVSTGVPYRIYLIDDGSTDNSVKLIRELQKTDNTLEIHSQSNAGHGPAILRGYRLAAAAQWIFQIDSDHQLEPKAFSRLWENREQYDLLLGERQDKNASPARQCLSRLSAVTVRLLFGAGVKDINIPYRLIRSSCLQEVLPGIPADSFAPNILITAWFIRARRRIWITPVETRNESRRPSRMNSYFLKGAWQAFRQTLLFRIK